MIEKEVAKRIPHDRFEFWGVELDRKDRAIIFSWFADTPYQNVTWARLFVLHLGWFPVQYFCGPVHPVVN